MILKLNGSSQVNYCLILIVWGLFFESLNFISKQVLLNATANCMAKN